MSCLPRVPATARLNGSRLLGPVVDLIVTSSEVLLDSCSTPDFMFESFLSFYRFVAFSDSVLISECDINPIVRNISSREKISQLSAHVIDMCRLWALFIGNFLVNNQ